MMLIMVKTASKSVLSYCGACIDRLIDAFLQWMQITNTANGKTVYAKTRDSCPGCGDNDLGLFEYLFQLLSINHGLDMSPAVFKQMASLDTGVIHVSWHFMAKGWSP